MANFWVSWFHEPEFGPFTVFTPWWVSGCAIVHEHETPIVCAAVIAADEAAAREHIRACIDKHPDNIEFRFVEARPASWSPFCDRFPKADWMRWPLPAALASLGVEVGND